MSRRETAGTSERPHEPVTARRAPLRRPAIVATYGTMAAGCRDRHEQGASGRIGAREAQRSCREGPKGLVAAGIPAPRHRCVSRSGARARAVAAGRPARPADLRARRHHEPAADLGHRLPIAGRHVPRGGRHRRPRRPACLFPRADRMPRVAMGVADGEARGPDGADRLPRRAHADRQSPRPRAQGIARA